jgi:hypothetical protein
VIDLRTTEREFAFRFRPAAELTDFFRVNYGPVRKAFEALDEAGHARLRADLTALATEHDATDEVRSRLTRSGRD